MTEVWYVVTLPYAAFGIAADAGTGKVVIVPPIGHWMNGKSVNQVSLWVMQNGGTMTPVPKVE